MKGTGDQLQDGWELLKWGVKGKRARAPIWRMQQKLGSRASRRMLQGMIRGEVEQEKRETVKNGARQKLGKAREPCMKKGRLVAERSLTSLVREFQKKKTNLTKEKKQKKKTNKPKTPVQQSYLLWGTKTTRNGGGTILVGVGMKEQKQRYRPSKVEENVKGHFKEKTPVRRATTERGKGPGEGRTKKKTFGPRGSEIKQGREPYVLGR